MIFHIFFVVVVSFIFVLFFCLQVSYESRMGGVARLYAACMISKLPKESLRAKRDHPHGIGNAWRWLASCLNLKPVNGVTTTLMVNILEVCGHDLLEK